MPQPHILVKMFLRVITSARGSFSFFPYLYYRFWKFWPYILSTCIHSLCYFLYLKVERTFTKGFCQREWSLHCFFPNVVNFSCTKREGFRGFCFHLISLDNRVTCKVFKQRMFVFVRLILKFHIPLVMHVFILYLLGFFY